MRVLKFGGTSLANADQFMHVASILENSIQNEQIAVVLSAPAKITNHLVSTIYHTLNNGDIIKNIDDIENIFFSLLNEIKKLQSNFDYTTCNLFLKKEFNHLKKILYGISLLKYCPDNVNSNIICLGEKLSVLLMKELLVSKNLRTIVIDPVQVIVVQDKCSVSIVDIEESTRRIKNIDILNKDVILMAGFTAGNKHGELVSLGRNGSDYSAAILAACLKATCCEIWTDVDGIYTCDPRQVPDAKLLHSLSYQEAMELSYFGAKILHPRTIIPIAQFHIPCLIKNIFKPHATGTIIGSDNLDLTNIVKGITYLQDMVMLNVSGPGMKGMIGMAARVFSAISKAICSVVLITQSSSEYSISFCIPNQDCLKTCDTLNEEFHLELKNGLLEPIDVMYNLAIISVVGDGMRTQLGLSGKLFGALALANINIIAIAQGSSERSISVVVKNSVTTIGVKAVHQILFNTDHHQIIEAFIIGTGGVGSALIDQIQRQYHWLKKKHIDLRVCGIINSRLMLIQSDGINLEHWRTSLIQAQKNYNLNQLISMIKKYHLLNPVIVDCTNSNQIANCYIDFLLRGFHVVAPNKKANTGSMKYYRALRDTVITSRRKFLYDTNVGAGLPVIENLQNLLNAGDELISFSGILSGSLSYIFGKLDEGLSLSKSTMLAKQYGYTEPDPRDDLTGVDVARKLLILAREAGYELELKDIYIEPVIPSSFINNHFDSVNNFLEKLSDLDDNFSNKIKKSHELGNVLRYVGNIEQGQCFVRIESVSTDHPFFKIKNGENALAFFTRYYQPLPLVLRGYGAGNNVTAAGVFADLLRTLS